MKRDLAYYLSLEYPAEIVRRKEGVFAFHPDLDGCAAQGETVEEALANLDVARRLWLEVRVEDGLPIEEPVSEDDFSGRVSLRMSPSLHADLARMSRRQKISLNQLLNTILAEYVGGDRLRQQVLEAVREIRETLLANASAPETIARTSTVRL
ncbi:MAG TPA: type II toxin-antitoxin system HicB family antitoxin [Thermoanaerobaculia bacterium]|nr:type II toxin-antitoxin system HicB family antitoxin [Thermoanaerobaculia bacterium]